LMRAAVQGLEDARRRPGSRCGTKGRAMVPQMREEVGGRVGEALDIVCKVLFVAYESGPRGSRGQTLRRAVD
jgi:hypothetical protein